LATGTPACRSQLVFREIAEPDHLDVTLVSLDDPEAVRPSHHIWTSSRIGWFEVADECRATRSAVRPSRAEVTSGPRGATRAQDSSRH
jgi:hypothetical protein